MKGKEIVEWSRFLNIHNDLEKLLNEYETIFFLLGENYLRALELPFENIDSNKKLIFLASKTSKKYIPNYEPYYFVEVGMQHAKAFRYGLIGLKGYLFKLFAEEWIGQGYNFLYEVIKEPSRILMKLGKYQKQK